MAGRRRARGRCSRRAGPPVLVDRPVQVPPPASDLDIGLIDEPPVTGRTSKRAAASTNSGRPRRRESTPWPSVRVTRPKIDSEPMDRGSDAERGQQRTIPGCKHTGGSSIGGSRHTGSRLTRRCDRVRDGTRSGAWRRWAAVTRPIPASIAAITSILGNVRFLRIIRLSLRCMQATGRNGRSSTLVYGRERGPSPLAAQRQDAGTGALTSGGAPGLRTKVA
jgi:hypothetical protein